MKVRWIGDARCVEGIGQPIKGQVYDLPNTVAASLIEQGKAVAVPDKVVETTAPLAGLTSKRGA
jgi:hypothetical protein